MWGNYFLSLDVVGRSTHAYRFALSGQVLMSDVDAFSEDLY